MRNFMLNRFPIKNLLIDSLLTPFVESTYLIDFVHTNAMNPFSKLTNGEKAMKNRYKLFIVFSKNRASPCQLSASYLFHPAQNGKIFQHRLIDFIHTNAMNPFSKLTYGDKGMQICSVDQCDATGIRHIY